MHKKWTERVELMKKQATVRVVHFLRERRLKMNGSDLQDTRSQVSPLSETQKSYGGLKSNLENAFFRILEFDIDSFCPFYCQERVSLEQFTKKRRNGTKIFFLLTRT